MPEYPPVLIGIAYLMIRNHPTSKPAESQGSHQNGWDSRVKDAFLSLKNRQCRAWMRHCLADCRKSLRL
jgi:hypothetical protein